MLKLAEANRIVDAAFAKAAEMKVKPLAGWCWMPPATSSRPNAKTARACFASTWRFGKAWAAVAMGASSRALANRAKGNPNFLSRSRQPRRENSCRRQGRRSSRTATVRFLAPRAPAEDRATRMRHAASPESRLLGSLPMRLNSSHPARRLPPSDRGYPLLRPRRCLTPGLAPAHGG